MAQIPAPYYSRLTYKVMAFAGSAENNEDICQRWAIEMIEAGHTAEILYVLAALEHTINPFELQQYLIKALAAVGLQPKTGNGALLYHAACHVFAMAAGIDTQHQLKAVHRLCMDAEDHDLLFDFSLLFWSWEDIDHGDESTHYWPDATRHNIADTVVNYARNWLTLHEQALKPG